MVSAYLDLLRRVVAARSDLARCLTRCRICGIEFLTHPRNAGRSDIRCIFGCRATDCRQRSTARSAAYYQTPEGKEKKRQRNARRGRSTPSAPPPPPPPPPPCTMPIRYLCTICSLVERRQVVPDEIIRVLSQHGIEFCCSFAHDRPP